MYSNLVESEIEQDEMISNLIYNINSIILQGDFKDGNELVDDIITQTNIYTMYADKYAYNKVTSVTDEIVTRVGQLKNIQKQHLVPTRIKDIIKTINW